MKEEDTISEIRYVVGKGMYQYQDARIALGNMLRSIVYRKKEGIENGETIEEGDTKSVDYNDREMDAILDGLEEENKLTKDERRHIDQLRSLIKQAKDSERMFESYLSELVGEEPIYYKWLKNVKGISTRLTANLLKEYSYCENHDTVSKVWSHSGMTPQGAKNKEKGEKINYDPNKKKLAWKIMDSFIKQRTEPYRTIYDNEKQRQMKKKELKEQGKEDQYKGSAPQSLGHASNRARRKGAKIFLQHYWVIARQLKGLSTVPPYVHDKLKHDNYIKPPHIPTILEPFDPMREAKK